MASLPPPKKSKGGHKPLVLTSEERKQRNEERKRRHRETERQRRVRFDAALEGMRNLLGLDVKEERATIMERALENLQRLFGTQAGSPASTTATFDAPSSQSNIPSSLSTECPNVSESDLASAESLLRLAGQAPGCPVAFPNPTLNKMQLDDRAPSFAPPDSGTSNSLGNTDNDDLVQQLRSLDEAGLVDPMALELLNQPHPSLHSPTLSPHTMLVLLDVTNPRMLDCNQAALDRMAAPSLEHARAFQPMRRLHLDMPLLVKLRDLFLSGQARQAQAVRRIKRADGKGIVWLETMLTLLNDPAKPGRVLGVSQPVDAPPDGRARLFVNGRVYYNEDPQIGLNDRAELIAAASALHERPLTDADIRVAGYHVTQQQCPDALTSFSALSLLHAHGSDKDLSCALANGNDDAHMAEHDKA
eukprot:TRINITY_DN10243_c0_g3_i1.p1 TRINITY_DN10243_c0_g3~~TRINITY_DN10243_c0_g3_i1.p1  ORF type:complete len:417 (+),score=80.63 TRINITY_DN10243_c0_g3_i1:120-1370(+)